MTAVSKRLIDVREASTYLGLAVGTLYNLVSMKQIPHVKLGRKLLFDLKDLDKWIEESKVEVIDID